MLCVCLSFPITELCLLKRRSDAFLISAFLTDEEQALTGGTVCFKHRLTSHSVFTSDTVHCSSRSCSATVFHCSFLDLYSFSCSVIQCIVSPVLRSVMLGCKEKMRLHIMVFLKKCSKLQKYTTGNRVFGGRLHFDTEQCRCIQYLQSVLPANTEKCIQSL